MAQGHGTTCVGRAQFSYVRTAPRKLMGLADLIRGKRVGKALALLQYCPRRGAGPLAKLLKSAVANADQRGGVDVDRLMVHTVRINEGQRIKRVRARSRGMAHPILKRSSHLLVELSER